MNPDRPGSLHFSSGFLESSRQQLYPPETLKSIFRPIVAEGAGRRVLDLGSGAGFFAIEFARWAGSGDLVVRLDRDARLLGRGPGPAICALGEQMPFADGCFDLVIGHFVLSRIEVTVAQAVVQEAVRVTRDGGQVLLLEPCLGMMSAHSQRHPGLSALAAVARQTKTRWQWRNRRIDENYGLRLAQVMATALTVDLVDLHLAKWYSGFPGPLPKDVLQRRLNDLESRDPVSDFVDAHGDLEADRWRPPGLVHDTGQGVLEIGEAGLHRLHELRVSEVRQTLGQESAAGSVEFIPVVRVLATKP